MSKERKWCHGWWLHMKNASHSLTVLKCWCVSATGSFLSYPMLWSLQVILLLSGKTSCGICWSEGAGWSQPRIPGEFGFTIICTVILWICNLLIWCWMALLLSQKALEQLLYTDRFFKNDFAVVLQPFLKHADPPRLPVSSDHWLFTNYYNL